MNANVDDTICAVATPMGEGGVGIIRISGEKALTIASRIVQLRSGGPLEHMHSHRMYVGDILEFTHHDRTPKKNGQASLDEALVVAMRAPRSYTGEDVIEIHCHGGPLVLQATCQGLIREGARLADPGEFTKRAFLNGRLDLTQAEAVLDTIRATTSSSLRIAQEQLRGTLSTEVDRIRDVCIHFLAHIEAGMDFVEEDLTLIGLDELSSTIERTLVDLDRLLQTWEEGRIICEGIRVAIVGRPNVGKSSLLNVLLQTDRAIVSTVPGTTRDLLEEVLNIRGIPVRLVDTAGLRSTEDPLEGEGIKRTHDAITQAELLLIVLDGSLPLTDEDRVLLTEHQNHKHLVVVNKGDLSCHVEASEVSALRQDFAADSSGEHGAQSPPVVGISAKTGQGMDQLRDEIRGLVLRPDFEPGDSPVVTRLRHKMALERAREAVHNVQTSVQAHLSGEFMALDIRAALDALGEITGQVSTDDILDQIFREFCIGK